MSSRISTRRALGVCTAAATFTVATGVADPQSAAVVWSVYCLLSSCFVVGSSALVGACRRLAERVAMTLR